MVSARPGLGSGPGAPRPRRLPRRARAAVRLLPRRRATLARRQRLLPGRSPRGAPGLEPRAVPWRVCRPTRASGVGICCASGAWRCATGCGFRTTKRAGSGRRWWWRAAERRSGLLGGVELSDVLSPDQEHTNRRAGDGLGAGPRTCNTLQHTAALSTGEGGGDRWRTRRARTRARASSSSSAWSVKPAWTMPRSMRCRPSFGIAAPTVRRVSPTDSMSSWKTGAVGQMTHLLRHRGRRRQRRREDHQSLAAHRPIRANPRLGREPTRRRGSISTQGWLLLGALHQAASKPCCPVGPRTRR